jgi:predicted  nucleic acid-binding Zn-ribbon protein
MKQDVLNLKHSKDQVVVDINTEDRKLEVAQAEKATALANSSGLNDDIDTLQHTIATQGVTKEHVEKLKAEMAAMGEKIKKLELELVRTRKEQPALN